jgi:hypothetical protein
VTNLAAGLVHPKDFGCTENALVVLDGLGGALDDQVRRDGVVPSGMGETFLLMIFLLQKCRLRVGVTARTVPRGHSAYENTSPERDSRRDSHGQRKRVD